MWLSQAYPGPTGLDVMLRAVAASDLTTSQTLFPLEGPKPRMNTFHQTEPRICMQKLTWPRAR
jgi:hypothetical protein